MPSILTVPDLVFEKISMLCEWFLLTRASPLKIRMHSNESGSPMSLQFGCPGGTPDARSTADMTACVIHVCHSCSRPWLVANRLVLFAPFYWPHRPYWQHCLNLGEHTRSGAVLGSSGSGVSQAGKLAGTCTMYQITILLKEQLFWAGAVSQQSRRRDPESSSALSNPVHSMRREKEGGVRDMCVSQGTEVPTRCSCKKRRRQGPEI